MYIHRKVSLIAVVLAVIPASLSFSQSQNFEATAKWIPDSANAIVLVRSNEIFNSPLAKQENWKTEHIRQFKSGASFIPLAVDQFMMASQVDFEFAEPVWQIAIFERSDNQVDIVKISERIGGKLEKVADHDAVVLPNDAYAIKIDDGTLGAMVPANRQLTARWLRKGKSSASARTSPYLSQAIKFADKNAHIIVAFDFSDSISFDVVKERIGGAGICKDSDLDAVCQAVAQLKGATLGITITDKINAAIKVDFSSPPSALDSNGKAILVSALTDNGLMIDDINEWESKISGSQMMFSGPLSNAGLRQIGILIEHPIAADFVSNDPYGDDTVDVKTRTKQYFDSIQHLLEDMEGKEAQALKTYAKWFEKYAKKIDDLSVVNVDPRALEFGTYVADSFREISMRLLDTNIQKVQTQSRYADRGYTTTGYYRYGYGRYRSGYYYNNSRNRARVSGQARLAGEKAAMEIVNQIQSESAKVRKELSQKFNFDF